VLTLKYPRHQSFGSCRRTTCMQSSPSMQRALLSCLLCLSCLASPAAART